MKECHLYHMPYLLICLLEEMLTYLLPDKDMNIFLIAAKCS